MAHSLFRLRCVASDLWRAAFRVQPRRDVPPLLGRTAALLAGRVASPSLPRARPPTLTPRQWALLAAPPLILAVMAATFRGLAGRFGARMGYLCGFSVYWLGWCFAYPLALLGRDGFRSLFRDARPRLGRPAWLGLLALVLPPALGGVAAFPKAIRQASPRVVLLSAGVAALNAVGEEVLWRGAFLRLFPGRLLLGYVYPAAGFALWHYAPQTVFPNRRPGGAHSFVASAGLFGLLYGWLAWRTGTIRWTSVSHTLLDFSGLGARLYLR